MIVWTWLDVIEKRLNSATPGKWYIGHISEIKRCAMDIDSEDSPVCDDVYGEANIAFILNSKEDIGRLISAVKVLSGALHYYANHFHTDEDGYPAKLALEQAGRME